MIPLFAICYSIILVLELIRFFGRVEFRPLVFQTTASLGLIAQTVYLSQEIFFRNGHVFDSIQGWMLTLAWSGMILYLMLLFSRPRTPFGLFLVPLVLVSIILGLLFADATPFPREMVGFWWRIIHGVAFLLAAVASFAGFMTGAMFFLQFSRLKHKRPLTGSLKLPSMEWLQTANSRSMLFLLGALALGIISGLAINQIKMPPHSAISVADPMIVMTTALFLFLGIYLFFTRPKQQGKRIALLTILCSLFLVTILILGLIAKNAHWRNMQPEQTLPIRNSERQENLS